MIHLHYWPTPNGQKISIFLEEAGVPYEVVPVNIRAGDQFKPEFLAISPNNRMPAIVDDDPPGGGGPLSVFESGAILLYLGEKTGRFVPKDLRKRVEVTEWLAWQVGGVGPMFGQAGHFLNYAPEPIPYARERYTREVNRLYGVLDRRLANREYVAGEYSIADMAIYPWVRSPDRFQQDVAAFPNVKRWIDTMGARPGVVRGMAVGKDFGSGVMDAAAKNVLFGQTAASVEAAAKDKK